MTEDTEWKKTFRIKNFTGENEDDWRVWSSKMLAYAQRRGYLEQLTVQVEEKKEEDQEEGKETTSSDEEVSDLNKIEQAKYALKNLEAISDLTIACDGEAWEIINNLQTPTATAYDI